ncbi:MAG: hypothetical protein OHK0052_02710 [Anaerolineales bacterium]
MLILVLNFALMVHLALMVVCVWRVWRGENAADRFIGADLLSTLTLSALVLLAILRGEAIYMDVALGLAALGFLGILAFVRFLADERVF